MRRLDELLRDAVIFHGCPDQVLGVRMAMAGCGALEIEDPKAIGERLVVFVDIDRCAGDAIQAVTGCSLVKRSLKHLDQSKMTAMFVNSATGEAVRVVVRDDTREWASAYAPGTTDPRKAQILAYRVMPEVELLDLQPVVVRPGWMDRREVACQLCGEGMNSGLEAFSDGLTLCRACFAGGYYEPWTDAPMSAKLSRVFTETA